MRDYTIITDSGCDLSLERLSLLGIESVDLSFRKADESVVHLNREMKNSDFYSEMRKGTVFQTSAVSPGSYVREFEKVLEQGNNIFYIGMSSGISSTFNSALIAAEECSADYPDSGIITFDSKCGSGGLGLLLFLASKKKKAGASLEELHKYVSEISPKICHWYTVDDLKYLKRGGRISAASAFTATVLDIKPVMTMDEAGRLTGSSKVRGRRQTIKALADKYRLLSSEAENGIYVISHADCKEDAILLESIINQESGLKAECISEIGPVIGSHSGPGTLALFFIGKRR